MKKIKIIEKSFWILCAVELIWIIIMIGLMGIYDRRVYIMTAIIFTLADPLIYLIIEAVKESIYFDYSGSRYIPVALSCLMFLGITVLYLYFNFLYEYFDSFWYLYYLSLILPFLISFFVFFILSKRRLKSDGTGPRIIRNR